MENKRVISLNSPELSNEFLMVTNPSGYEHFVPDPRALIEACGFLPSMLVKSEVKGQPFKETLDANYPFGSRWNDRATVDKNGVYHYPEDEPLHPIVSVTNVETGEEAYIYQYGIVAARNEKGDYLTGRFD